MVVQRSTGAHIKFVVDKVNSKTESFFFGLQAAAALELKENLAAGAVTWPYSASRYHPYDTAFAGYSFNG